MDMHLELNHSSPIVQRVLRLRECRAWQETDSAQAGTSYQWQMWQKSDFSAYTREGGSEHSCKGVPISPSLVREEDWVKI